MSFKTIGYAADTVDVCFYDITGAYMDSTSLNSDIAGGNFVGFYADEGQYIGRVHIVSQNGLQQGTDNLPLYSETPEPATLSLLALAGLAVLRRHRRKPA